MSTGHRLNSELTCQPLTCWDHLHLPATSEALHTKHQTQPPPDSAGRSPEQSISQGLASHRPASGLHAGSRLVGRASGGPTHPHPQVLDGMDRLCN